jgi:hypothetical protein
MLNPWRSAAPRLTHSGKDSERTHAVTVRRLDPGRQVLWRSATSAKRRLTRTGAFAPWIGALGQRCAFALLERIQRRS